MTTRERQIRKMLRTHATTMRLNDKWAWRYFYDVRYLLRVIDQLQKNRRPEKELS